MPNTGLFRAMAAILAIAVTAFPSTLPAATTSDGAGGITTASLRGTIQRSPGAGEPASPVAGAIVKATEIGSGKTFQSSSSDESGLYGLSGLPPGSYALSVHTGAGIFLSDGIVGVQAGQQRRVSFALQPDAAGSTPNKTDEGGSSGGQGEGGKPAEPGGSKPKPGSGFWARHPWLAGGAVAGTAIVLGVLADALTDEETQKKEEPTASPSSP